MKKERAVTLRDTASVTVSKPVDGTKRRRKPTKGQRAVIASHSIKVDPRVWAVAQSLCGPHQSIQIAHATEVRVVNKKEACHG